MISRPCTTGQIRQEVCNFVSNAWKQRYTDPELSNIEIIDCPIQKFPTDTARNVLVNIAHQHNVDLLFMIDEDASPPYSFFKQAIQFLTKQPIPSVYGCPYLSGDGEAQVFRFIPVHSPDPVQPAWKLLRIPRAEAFIKKGVDRVASIGTHCICYDMRVFNQIAKPYYRYSYNEDHTAVVETEDCYAHRNMVQNNIPIFCNFDSWAGHWKLQEIGPLEPLEPHQLPKFWKDRVKEYFLYHEEGKKELAQGFYTSNDNPQDTVPHDVDGWCNDPYAITKLIAECPDNGTFVEIGCWQGKSSIHAAKQARLTGKNIKVYSVDTFEGTKDEKYHQQHINKLDKSLYEMALENIKKHNVENIVTLIKNDSVEASKDFVLQGVDVVFIDGDHSYQGCKRDIEAWWSKLKQGGIMAGDDYAPEFPGVIKAVDELKNVKVCGRTWKVTKY